MSGSLPVWTREGLKGLVDRTDPEDPESCVDAFYHVELLAPFLLSDPVLSKVQALLGPFEDARSRAREYARRGCVLPLFVWERKISGSGIFRSCFCLPFKWSPGERDSPDLPRGMTEVADSIRSALKIRNWRLTLAEGVDLSGLDVDAPSAFALLAAGLILAPENLPLDPGITASAGFDPDRGTRDVDSLDAKLATARAIGCRLFYVSPGNEAEATLLAEDGLEVAALRPRTLLREALRPMLAVLRAPPAGEAPLGERIEYHGRLWKARRNDAATYYREHLLDELLEAIRTVPGVKEHRGGTLITVLSKSPEVALFAISALRPTTCVVLCTPESHPDRSRSAHWVYERMKTECAEITDPVTIKGDVVESVRAAVLELADRLGQAPLVVDFTPGPKHLSLAALEALRVRGAGAVYLGQEWQDDGPLPGTERLIWLRHPIGTLPHDPS